MSGFYSAKDQNYDTFCCNLMNELEIPEQVGNLVHKTTFRFKAVFGN
jgi:hypothetical protein